MRRFKQIASILGLMACAGCSEPSTSDADPATPTEPFTVISRVSVKPAGTVAERVAAAIELAAKDDYLKAIQKLEEAILIDERDRKVRLLLVEFLMADSKKFLTGAALDDPLYRHKQVTRASSYLEGLREYHPDQTEEEKKLALEVFYELARVQAKEMQDGEAFIALRQAVGAGFRDFDRVRADPDWRGMLARPGMTEQFEKIVADAKTP